MPRHRRFLSLWVMTGLVIGLGSSVLGVGGSGVVHACSCTVVADDQAFDAADVVSAVVAGSVDREQVATPDTTLPTDAPTSGKNSTAGLLVLIGVVVIVGTGALLLTVKYRKR